MGYVGGGEQVKAVECVRTSFSQCVIQTHT